LEEYVKKIKELIDYPEGGIVSKQIAKGKQDVTLFCLSAGTGIGDHTSAKEGFVYIIEGRGSFTLEGKEIDMLPGVLIFMKSNALHSLKAEENTALLLFLA